jgi:hypothetical protein
MTSGPPEVGPVRTLVEGGGAPAAPSALVFSQQAEEMMSDARLQDQAISNTEFISAVQGVGALETARETEAAAKAALRESDRTPVVLPRHLYG